MYLNVILGNSLVVQLLVLGAVTGWETKDPTSCTVWPKRKKSPSTEERADWHLASAFHLLIVATGQYLFPAVREEAYRVIPCGFAAETISRWNYIFSVLQKGPNKSPLKKKIIYFLLCWVFSATWTFSSCRKWGWGGLLSSCFAWASHSSGFFCCRAQAPGPEGCGSYGSWALEHRLSSCDAQA